jgi:hypothetical protein
MLNFRPAQLALFKKKKLSKYEKKRTFLFVLKGINFESNLSLKLVSLSLAFKKEKKRACSLLSIYFKTRK